MQYKLRGDFKRTVLSQPILLVLGASTPGDQQKLPAYTVNQTMGWATPSCSKTPGGREVGRLLGEPEHTHSICESCSSRHTEPKCLPCGLSTGALSSQVDLNKQCKNNPIPMWTHSSSSFSMEIYEDNQSHSSKSILYKNLIQRLYWSQAWYTWIASSFLDLQPLVN